MARGFKRKGRGHRATYAATLDSFERQLLGELFAQVVTLLDPEGTATRTREMPADADEFDRIVAGIEVGGATGGHQGPGGPGGVGDPGGVAGSGGFGAMGGTGDPAAYEHDPALRRLLPTANRADEEAAAEFRRLTEQGLRQRKLANLRAAIAVMEREDDGLVLDRATALAVLVAFTDVRLVLASRLGLETDEDAERLHAVVEDVESDDPFAQAAAIYEFLTWLQDTLAGCLAP